MKPSQTSSSFLCRVQEIRSHSRSKTDQSRSLAAFKGLQDRSERAFGLTIGLNHLPAAARINFWNIGAKFVLFRCCRCLPFATLIFCIVSPLAEVRRDANFDTNCKTKVPSSPQKETPKSKTFIRRTIFNFNFAPRLRRLNFFSHPLTFVQQTAAMEGDANCSKLVHEG